MTTSGHGRAKSRSAQLDFEDPPVAEVVLSTAFEALAGLGVVEIGPLWMAAFRESFPIVEEQLPYEMPVERFSGRDQASGVSFQVMTKGPRPRMWFLSEARAQLVQVQDNWFARNWRRMPEGGDYPRFPALRASFERDFKAFAEYVRSRDLGEIKPSQCEVTYINHIANPKGSSGGLHDILNVVVRGSESLPAPEGARFGSQYVIHDPTGPRGRLHVIAEQAVVRSSGQPVTVLTLTARGEPVTRDLAAVLDFFDLGRESIERTFLGLIRPELRAVWRQRNGD